MSPRFLFRALPPLFAGIALSWAAAGAAGVEPKAALKGPRNAYVGSTVMLDGLGSVADPDQPLQWVAVDPPDLLYVTFDKGNRRDVIALFVAEKPGRYEVAVAAVGSSGVDNKPKVAVAVWAVNVLAPPSPSPLPPAPPAPQPIPPPPPSPSASKYNLEAVVAAAAPQITIIGQARTDAASSLASSFRAMAAQSKSYTDVQSFVTATGDNNRRALGATYVALKPVLSALNQRLAALVQAGTLATVDDHVEAWAEIARGLEQVQ
jgi:hypothetical protein